MRAIVLCVAALTVASCGSSTPVPTSPGAPVPHWSISGTVVATGTATPVPGAKVESGSLNATTDAGGNFTLTGDYNPVSPMYLMVSATGYLTRETRISLPRTSTTIDLIQDAAPFSLSFYRELARNGLESPNTLQPLRRWTSNPTFYIIGTDDSGQPVSDAVIALLREHLPRAFSAWTNGVYAPTVENGAQDRAEADGQIRVMIRRDKDRSLPYCGRSIVGGPRGFLELNLDGCRCGTTALALNVVWHEVGHAAGFFHVADEQALIHTPSPQHCTTNPVLTAAEQYHASIMYRRPRMNRDVDVDPAEFALQTTGAATQPTVVCPKR